MNRVKGADNQISTYGLGDDEKKTMDQTTVSNSDQVCDELTRWDQHGEEFIKNLWTPIKHSGDNGELKQSTVLTAYLEKYLQRCHETTATMVWI